jgi:hypothetical protein
VSRLMQALENMRIQVTRLGFQPMASAEGA